MIRPIVMVRKSELIMVKSVLEYRAYMVIAIVIPAVIVPDRRTFS